MNRRSFLKSITIAAIAAAVPIKLTSAEKKALKSDNALTAAQAKTIENKLIEAVYSPVQRRQKYCLHVKGGRWIQAADRKQTFSVKRTNRIDDFAVSDHTFIDGSRRVCCLLCFKKWFPDTPEWKEAEYMLLHTTNTRTSSQVVGKFIPHKDKVVFMDSKSV